MLAGAVGRSAPRGIDLGGVQKVTARTQDVVADPGAWAGVLDDIAAAAGAQSVTLLCARSNRLDVSMISTSAGMEQPFERYFREGWDRRDLRARAVPKMLKTGVGVDQDFIDPDTMEREPFYQELLAPYGLRWWAGVAFPSGNDLWWISIQRRIEQGYFDPEEQAKLATLRAGLIEAVTISLAVGGSRIAAMTEALDLVEQPALVLDRSGRILRENAAAEKLYDDWFYVAGGRIVAKDREAAAAFAALAETCRSRVHLVLAGSRIVVRRGERRPVVVTPHTLSGAAVEPFSGGRVLLLLNDLDRRALSCNATLAAVFGLTPAEARFAAIIGGGDSLEQACGTLGITRETARSLLKVIFLKTGVHRQTELVALLARLSVPKGR